MYLATNKPRTSSQAVLLAEAVATGLHSLAQPLTKAQWRLEAAVMNGPDAQDQSCLGDALTSIEEIVAQLNILRDIIRPFRPATEFKPERLRDALLRAAEDQQEEMEREGVRVVIHEACANGTVTVPRGFVDRIMVCLSSLLRSLKPSVATFDIYETSGEVLVLASLVYGAKSDVARNVDCSTIRTYVEVLGGSFSLAENLSSIRISLPRCTESI